MKLGGEDNKHMEQQVEGRKGWGEEGKWGGMGTGGMGLEGRRGMTDAWNNRSSEEGKGMRRRKEKKREQGAGRRRGQGAGGGGRCEARRGIGNGRWCMGRGGFSRHMEK